MRWLNRRSRQRAINRNQKEQFHLADQKLGLILNATRLAVVNGNVGARTVLLWIVLLHDFRRGLSAGTPVIAIRSSG